RTAPSMTTDNSVTGRRRVVAGRPGPRSGARRQLACWRGAFFPGAGRLTAPAGFGGKFFPPARVLPPGVPGHGRLAGVPAAAADPADVAPARPRRRRQGRRTARAPARDGGAAPAGTPPKLQPADRVVLASRPPVGLLRHVGNAAALAPRTPGSPS